jgi:hypothetical protein
LRLIGAVPGRVDVRTFVRIWSSTAIPPRASYVTMKDQPDHLPIGAFAAAAGVNIETIRFYQRKGLLPRPRRSYGRIRRYGAADVARVNS